MCMLQAEPYGKSDEFESTHMPEEGLTSLRFETQQIAEHEEDQTSSRCRTAVVEVKFSSLISIFLPARTLMCGGAAAAAAA